MLPILLPMAGNMEHDHGTRAREQLIKLQLIVQLINCN